MNILQLCYRIPFPPKDGGSIAMNNISELILQEGHTLKTLAINTNKHFVDINKLPATYTKNKSFEAVDINTDITLIGAVKNLFSAQSYHIQRFYSKEFDQKLDSILSKQKFDLVHLESIYTAPYLNTIKKHGIKTIIRTHNVEHQVWQRLADEEKNILKKIYLKIQTRRLKKYENQVLNSVDGIVSISSIDTKIFKTEKINTSITNIPTGIDLQNYNHSIHSHEVSKICFIGALDWQPNYNGLMWFLKNARPKVNNQFPLLELHIAGRNTPYDLLNLKQPNVFVHGEINDAHEFIRNANAMIVPLFSGSGIRIKIIEAMALGCPVISTNIGAEGIDVTTEKNILIANNKNEFISQLKKLCEQPTLTTTIAQNAKEYIVNNYSNHILGKKLITFYQQIIS